MLQSLFISVLQSLADHAPGPMVGHACPIFRLAEERADVAKALLAVHAPHKDLLVRLSERVQEHLDARGLAAIFKRFLVAFLGDPAVFERHKALFAPQVRIIEILGDLAEPHAHAALAAEAVEGVHRAEKRLARQLFGDALAPGKREKIAVHIVKVHGVDLFKLRQHPHPLLSIRRRKTGFLTKKSVHRDGFFSFLRFDDLFPAALRARQLDLAHAARHAAVCAAGAADVFVRLVGAAGPRAANGVRLRRPPGQKFRILGLTAREIARKNAEQHHEHQRRGHKVQRLRHAAHMNEGAQQAEDDLKHDERPAQRVHTVAAVHEAVEGIAEFAHSNNSPENQDGCIVARFAGGGKSYHRKFTKKGRPFENGRPLDSREIAARRFRSREGAVQEGHSVTAVAGAVGIKDAAAVAGGDLVVHSPENGVVERGMLGLVDVREV